MSGYLWFFEGNFLNYILKIKRKYFTDSQDSEWTRLGFRARWFLVLNSGSGINAKARTSLKSYTILNFSNTFFNFLINYHDINILKTI